MQVRHNKMVELDYRGAPQTIAIIKKAVLDSQSKPQVRLLAEEVTKHLQSKDRISEALAIYYLVVSRTRYMSDPRTVELVRAPWLVIDQMMAGHTPGLDCDDLSSLICALLVAAGHQCRVVTVAFRNMFYKGQRQYSHVFAQVKEPYSGEWLTLDPVAAEKTEEMKGRVRAAKFWPIA